MDSGFASDQRWRTRNQTVIDAGNFSLFGVCCINRLARGDHPWCRGMVWFDTYKEEMLQSRKDSLPTVMDPMPEQQRLCDRPLIDHDKAIVWNGCDDPLGQARLRALMAPHAGVWLQTIPLTACGLGLDNEAVTVAGLRLGLTLCAPHRCQCGEVADQGGHHALTCRRSVGRAAQHAAINDIIWRALSKAG